MPIELNDQFKQALDLCENTDKNVFITGKAGTGKSTLLDYFRNHTTKNIVVVAPTGVAAVNVRGQTIHSFFKFKPDITPDKVQKIKSGKARSIYRKLDAIVIDEISMVRADLLDCVDKFLRLNGQHSHQPFGGLQMIFIGDLYQLPPVVSGADRQLFQSHYQSPYFFDANVMAQFEIVLVELEKIYRQKDEHFIHLLNSIRNNSIDEEQLDSLNQRLNPHFQPKQDELYIHLTTTNNLADTINHEHLERSPEKAYRFTGDVLGAFDRQSFPTAVELVLKVDAQVMLLSNDHRGRWVNGTIGKIIQIAKPKGGKPTIITCQLETGEHVEIGPHTWEMFQFRYNGQTQKVESEIIGSFTQYPLRLAWALTIHKSQGKTFDKVIIDIGRGTFTHGHAYVALSRCRTLEGIVLKKPIAKKHIFMDWRVVKFLTHFQYQRSAKQLPTSEKVNIIEQAIDEGQSLEIVYLKNNDEKSRRIITPESVGQMEYLGKMYLGVSGFDSKRQESRTFRVDRILEMKVI